MEPQTVAAYEADAAGYRDRRPPRHTARAEALAARALPGKPIADLGCGPGGYVGALGSAGRRVVAADAAAAMLDLVAPAVERVRADLEALPFARHSLGAAWARNSYLHVPAERLPLALASLHHAVAPGGALTMSMIKGEGGGRSQDLFAEDDIPGRYFALWPPGRLADVVEGAGFALAAPPEEEGPEAVWVTATRARTLPDYVGPGMRALVCGLNPSVLSADVGVGFARAGNRFWGAAAASGLCGPDRVRDPWRLLAVDGVGMTDLVKRATPRADELTRDEYRAGAARVARLAAWLAPEVVVFVGLDGWRKAIDSKAVPGFQAAGIGGRPAYVMPSTSGLNARVPAAELAGHLRAALGGR